MISETFIVEYYREFLTTFICGVIFLSFYYLSRRNPHVSYYLDRDFKGPKAYPIVGNGLDLMIENHEIIPTFKRFRDEYGHFFRIWLGNKGFVVFTRAKEAEKILSSSLHINKATEYNIVHDWLGFGLLTSNGSKWHSRRKMLTPTFHFKILDEFNETMNEHTDTLINLLEKESQGGKAFEISKFLTRCALDIICETAMGKKINAQIETDSEYIKSIYEVAGLAIKRFMRPWLHPKLIWYWFSDGRREQTLIQILHKFTNSVIQERKMERLESKNLNQDTFEESYVQKRKAFLDLLLDISDSENGQVLTDQDLREETDTFMFEGHDTTSSNLLWTVFLLARHPEHQKKVQEELDEIFGNDRTKQIVNADMAKMKYLECCIKESLRIFPSVPIFGRNVTQDVTFESGQVLPKGCRAFIHAYLIHHDPEVFPDPELFKPERFFPENIKGRNPYAYIPFSAGPRNCIGQKFALQEEKIILSKVLVNFNLETTMDPNKVRKVPDLILRPIDEILIKITKRK